MEKKFMVTRYVQAKDLQKYLSCCYNTAVKIAEAAGARRNILGMIRYDLVEIDAYIARQQ